MSAEQEHMISRPEMKGPETKYFNTDIKNILSSISNIIKPNDEIIDSCIDKDKELPEGETWNQLCTISCSSGVRRKIEYWSGYRSFDNYEEMCDDMRDAARSINNNSTIYTDENNFKQSVLFGGCLAENVVDLRTRNVNVKKRNSNFPWETINFPWSFTMCYVLSFNSRLYDRRSGWNVFSNSLVDAYFTNVEYKSEKLEKSIVLKIPQGDYLDRNEILSVCYVFRLLKHMDMENLFDIDYKLVITDYDQKTFEITKNNYILLDDETYTVIDLLNKTEVENDDDDEDDVAFMMLNSDYDNDDL